MVTDFMNFAIKNSTIHVFCEDRQAIYPPRVGTLRARPPSINRVYLFTYYTPPVCDDEKDISTINSAISINIVQGNVVTVL